MASKSLGVGHQSITSFSPWLPCGNQPKIFGENEARFCHPLVVSCKFIQFPCVVHPILWVNTHQHLREHQIARKWLSILPKLQIYWLGLSFPRHSSMFFIMVKHPTSDSYKMPPPGSVSLAISMNWSYMCENINKGMTNETVGIVSGNEVN